MDGIRILLSALWVALVLTYLYGDVLRIFSGDVARMGGTLHFTQAMWLGIAVLMLIPILMVVLSLVLPNEHYTEAKLQSMFGGSEININFPKNIWVHLTYQTAFVDEDGKLVGRVTVNAVMDFIRAESESDVLNLAGLLCCIVGLLVTIPISVAATTVAYREIIGFDPATTQTL